MSLGRLQAGGAGSYIGFTGKPLVPTPDPPMQPLRRTVNPFALMLDPQAVLAQIENSERLERLQRRVCRPLDKPLLGGVGDGTDEANDAGTTGPDADSARNAA
jgi:hypothetical protein